MLTLFLSIGLHTFCAVLSFYGAFFLRPTTWTMFFTNIVFCIVNAGVTVHYLLRL